MCLAALPVWFPFSLRIIFSHAIYMLSHLPAWNYFLSMPAVFYPVHPSCDLADTLCCYASFEKRDVSLELMVFYIPQNKYVQRSFDGVGAILFLLLSSTVWYPFGRMSCAQLFFDVAQALKSASSSSLSLRAIVALLRTLPDLLYLTLPLAWVHISHCAAHVLNLLFSLHRPL